MAHKFTKKWEMLNVQTMHIVYLIVSAFIVTSTIYYSYNFFKLSQEIERTQPKIDQIDYTINRITGNFGHNSLIHHYYLCLLSNEESFKYCSEAKAKAIKINNDIDRLEHVAKNMDGNPELKFAKTSTKKYIEKIIFIEKQKEKGADLSNLHSDVKNFNFNQFERINTLKIYEKSKFASQFTLAIEKSQKIITLVALQVAALLIIILLYVRIYKSLSAGKMRVEDFDSLRLANHQLRISNGALVQFAAIAAHDLKAPARHISLHSDQIRLTASDNTDILNLADSISRSASQIDALTTSLFAFSRSGFQAPKIELVPLRPLIDDAIHLAVFELPKSDIGIQVESLPELVFADPALLTQVFLNLLSNAIKYRAPGRPTKITITGEDEGGFVKLAFADNGIGIPPEYAEKVFDPFQRVHPHDDQYEGTGIGLTLVKSVIQAHNGNVFVDSTYRNGAKLVLVLPNEPD